jgi:hypothetical protein
MLLCSFGPASHAADAAVRLRSRTAGRRTSTTPESLTLRAAPQVIEGARVRLRPGGAGCGGFDRYWVVGRGGVSVLDAGFAEAPADRAAGRRRRRRCSRRPTRRKRTRCWWRLGSRAYRIDTATETLAMTVVETGAALERGRSAAGLGPRLPGRRRRADGLAHGGRDGRARRPLDDAARRGGRRLAGHRATTPSGLAALDFSLLSDAFFQPGERPSRTRLWATA